MTLDILTTRQREVAQLVAIGFTDKAIAARIGCKARTVDFHLRSIIDAWHLDKTMNPRVQITRYVLRAA